MAWGSGQLHIEDVRPGDNACLLFDDSAEQVDLVTAYAGDGIALGERVLLSGYDDLAPLAERLAGRGADLETLVRDGQVVVVTPLDASLAYRYFHPEQLVCAIADQIDLAQRRGYTGLRIASDLTWVAAVPGGVDRLIPYETATDVLLEDRRATAMCQYDLRRFDRRTLAQLTEAHRASVATGPLFRDARLTVRRQHTPLGLRFEGDATLSLELRSVIVDELARLDAASPGLTATGSGQGAEVVIDLGGATALDPALARLLISTAARLSPALTVRCHPSERQVLQGAGAASIPNLRMAEAGPGADQG